MRKIGVALLFLSIVVSSSAQSVTKRYQNILDDRLYDYIVAESSGEKALNSAADLASYELTERRFDALKESEYILAKLSGFGITTAKLNRYDGASAWRASTGTLIEVVPNYRKLADVTDIPAQLCPGSQTIVLDSVELVWVGRASSRELELIDLKGKIAFGEVPAYQMHDRCVEKGALGIVSCFAPRLAEAQDPLQLPNFDLFSGKPTFGFQLSARDGYLLRDRLLNGETVRVSVNIEREIVNFQYQSPECVIEGSHPESGEIIFSAHLFEGYNKLGANDNISGSVVLLEVARTLNALIEGGKLTRPKRSIRFIWGDEFYGIIPWVNEQNEIMDRALFNINLDMVGIGLNRADSQYILHRNRSGDSHYSTDLSEAMMEYLWMTNQNSLIVGDFVKPVVAKNGSHDRFQYAVTPYYPASDHSVFCDWGIGIPAVVMVTWPDKHYHSSADRVEYLDPTQLKRATVIAATIAVAVASATEKEAMYFSGLSLAGALKRLGTVLANGFNTLQKEATREGVKRVLNDMDALLLTEIKAICSVEELDENSSSLKTYTGKLVEQLTVQCEAAKKTLVAHYNACSGKPYETVLGATEKRASQLFFRTTPQVKAGGYDVFRRWRSALSPERRSEFDRLGIGVADDLVALTSNPGWSLADVKKIYDYDQLTDISFESIEAFFEMLAKDGFLEKIKNKE